MGDLHLYDPLLPELGLPPSNLLPELGLPSLDVLPVGDLHLYDLPDLLDLFVREELLHHQGLLTKTKVTSNKLIVLPFMQILF